MSDQVREQPSETPAPTAERKRTIVRRRSDRRRAYAVLAGVVIVVVVLLAGVEAGWFAQRSKTPKAGACPTGVTLLAAGANFILPLVSQWGISYGQQTSNQINYNPAGAGVGITALTDKTVDFAATDESLNTSQYSALPGKILTLPVAAGALAVVYNLPGVTPPVQLSGLVLSQIYLGQITNWNDSRIANNNSGVKLPNLSITAVHRSDAAGTTYVLTDFLSQDSAAWASGPGKGIQISWPSNPPAAVALKGNSGIASYVQKNPDTIGYVDLTDVLNTPGLQYAKILNPSRKYVLPNIADTASAIANKSAVTTYPPATGNWQNVSMVNSPGTGDYPLATFSYFLVYQAVDVGYSPSLAKAQVIVQWLNWTITKGQSLSANLYYVTVPPSLVALDKASLLTMTFDGNLIPTCT